MAILHRKLQMGLHRFTGTKKIESHWSMLLTLFKDNPEWKMFLTDQGKAEVPIAYLVAVEEGLRSFGTDKHAFGKFAMDNETEWHNQKLNCLEKERMFHRNGKTCV